MKGIGNDMSIGPPFTLTLTDISTSIFLLLHRYFNYNINQKCCQYNINVYKNYPHPPPPLASCHDAGIVIGWLND